MLYECILVLIGGNLVQKEKLWTKTFIFTSIVNFVMMLSMYLLLVTLAEFSMEKYDASTSLAGLVASIFIIGVLFGRLFSGKQIDRIGTKNILLIGIFIFIVMSFFYFIDMGVGPLIIVRIIQGIGLGLATTATGTIVSQVIPPSRNGEGISYFSISVVLSTAIGPFIGIVLVRDFGYTSIFIFSTVVGILSLIMALWIKAPVIEQIETAQAAKKFSLTNLFEMKALPVSISLFVVALGYAGILSFLTAFTKEIDLVQFGGLFFLVYAITVILTRPFTGKLMDVKGANSIAYPGIILAALGMLILSQTHSVYTFLLASVFMGLGYGNFQSCTQAIAIKLTPIERMGLANSTYFIFLDFAIGMGPLFLGLIEPAFGFRGMYLVLSGVIMVGLFVYYVTHGRVDYKLVDKSS